MYIWILKTVKVLYVSVCYTLASKWITVDIPVKVCTWELVGWFPIFYYCAITAFRLSKIKKYLFQISFLVVFKGDKSALWRDTREGQVE